jgi:hypothetical protein
MKFGLFSMNMDARSYAENAAHCLSRLRVFLPAPRAAVTALTLDVYHCVIVFEQHPYFSLVTFPIASHPDSTCTDPLGGLPSPVQEPTDQQHYPHDHQPQGPAERVETKPQPADAHDQLEEKDTNHEERDPDQ